MALTIDYYVSMNSPWTYLAGARFLKLRETYGFTVRTKPSKFGEIFAETGGLPLPKRSPARQAYRMMELKRWRDFLDIPIALEPQHFPSDETAAARLVIAAQDQGLDAVRLTMEIGRELWERETNIAETAVLITAAKRAGLDYDQVTGNAPEDSVLDATWGANTTEAISRGVFGAPSFVFEGGEVFWGQDRIELFERAVQNRS